MKTDEIVNSKVKTMTDLSGKKSKVLLLKNEEEIEAFKKQLALCNVVVQSEQLVCCENCTHFDKQDKTCSETCVNWSAHNKAN